MSSKTVLSSGKNISGVLHQVEGTLKVSEV